MKAVLFAIGRVACDLTLNKQIFVHAQASVAILRSCANAPFINGAHTATRIDPRIHLQFPHELSEK